MKKIHTLIATFLLPLLLTAQTSNHALEWGYGFGTTSDEILIDFAIDTKGDIISVGEYKLPFDVDPSVKVVTTDTCIGNQDIFITKYSPKGQLIWGKSIGGVTRDNVIGIQLDYNDNIYIVGIFKDSIDVDASKNKFVLKSVAKTANIFLAKYDNDFNLKWAKNIEKIQYASTYMDPISFDLDFNGNIYITGQFSDSVDFNADPNVANILSAKLKSNNFSHYPEVFFVKYTTDGNFEWAKQLPPPTEYYKPTNDVVEAQVKKIVVDKLNNCFYLGGKYYGVYDLDPSASFDTIKAGTNGVNRDFFIGKYTLQGDYIWGKTIGGPSSNDLLRSMTIDTAGSLYVAGTFAGVADFSPETSIDTLRSLNAPAGNTGIDVFIAKYTSKGNYVWAKSIGGAYSDDVHTINSTKDGNIYIGGCFLGNNVDFNPLHAQTALLNTMGSLTSYDAYYASYSGLDGSYNWVNAVTGIVNENDRYITGIIKEGLINEFYYSGNTTSDTIYNFNVNNQNKIEIYKPNNGKNNDYFLVKNFYCNLNSNVSIGLNSITSLENTVGATYQWYNCDSNKAIANATQKTFKTAITGNYKVKVTVGTCNTSSECISIVSSLPEVDNTYLVQLYPNPVNNSLKITLQNKPLGLEHIKISIIDLLGNQLIDVHNGLVTNNYSNTINVANLSNGVYFVKVNNSVKRFVKQ